MPLFGDSQTEDLYICSKRRRVRHVNFRFLINTVFLITNYFEKCSKGSGITSDVHQWTESREQWWRPNASQGTWKECHQPSGMPYLRLCVRWRQITKARERVKTLTDETKNNQSKQYIMRTAQSFKVTKFQAKQQLNEWQLYSSDYKSYGQRTNYAYQSVNQVTTWLKRR